MLSKAAGYSAIEHLRDGRQIEVRAFRPEDPSALIAAVGQVGPRSSYLRFFTLKRKFSDREREFFLNVDFDEHVACQKPIIAAGRYVCVAPGKAEGRISLWSTGIRVDLPISEIAWMLGYRRSSSFNHAFKRWTGKAPGWLRTDGKARA